MSRLIDSNIVPLRNVLICEETPVWHVLLFSVQYERKDSSVLFWLNISKHMHSPIATYLQESYCACVVALDKCSNRVNTLEG